jgi:hypothetical protein
MFYRTAQRPKVDNIRTEDYSSEVITDIHTKPKVSVIARNVSDAHLNKPHEINASAPSLAKPRVATSDSQIEIVNKPQTIPVDQLVSNSGNEVEDYNN